MAFIPRHERPTTQFPMRLGALVLAIVALVGCGDASAESDDRRSATATSKVAFADATRDTKNAFAAATQEAKDVKNAADAEARVGRAADRNATAEARATTQELQAHVPLGVVLTTNEWDYIVRDVEYVDHIDTLLPQGRYVVVALNVTNKRREQSSLRVRSAFNLYDNLGNKYNVADSAPGQSGDPSQRSARVKGLRTYFDSLLPSMTMETVVAFDVVPYSDSYELGAWNSGKRRMRLDE